MPDVEYQDWRDQHESDNYPFSDEASMTNEDGHTIPKGIFLDARIYAIGGAARQFVSNLYREAHAMTIVLSDADGELARGEIDIDNPEIKVPFYDQYDRPAGVMIVDTIAVTAFRTWSVGDHLYNSTQTPLAASVVVPTPQVGVRGFVLADGSFHTKDVWFVGGNGAVVTRDGANIRIDVVGDPLFLRRACESIGIYEPIRYLQTVNNLGPNEYGDLKITVGSDDSYASDPVLRVETSGTSIKISIVNV